MTTAIVSRLLKVPFATALDSVTYRAGGVLELPVDGWLGQSWPQDVL